MNIKEYRSKVLGCFAGKNIGGTLGTPFEGGRPKQYVGMERYYGVDYYVHDIDGDPLPNDDLDLQLIWLNAAEKYGMHLNSRILGEYWLSYEIGHPEEYGACKANLSAGIVPPLAGYLNNPHRNSNGAWIRSEIWACLAPGYPNIAAKYAIMDAEVDHSYEGIYSEAFCAAVQSAAFVENDKYKLIDIGLSFIPKDCGVRRAIYSVMDSYKKGLSWKEAFEKLTSVEPGCFGASSWKHGVPREIPISELGYNASNNIGIFIIGWLYGEDDFGKSICTAVNCGEDTDCTAGTLAAILGIIHGIENIPEKWNKPIGMGIKTAFISEHGGTIQYPKNVYELADRIMRLAPQFLGSQNCDVLYGSEGYLINPPVEKDLQCNWLDGSYWVVKNIEFSMERNPFEVKYNFELMEAVLDYTEKPTFQKGAKKKFKLRLRSTRGHQSWVRIKLYHPEGVTASPGDMMCVYMYQFWHAMSEMEFEISIDELNSDKLEMVMELSIEGRSLKEYIPITLLGENGYRINGYGD